MNKIRVRQALTNILYKSATDEEFRKSLLRDGRNILEYYLNERLESDIRVEFIENENRDREMNIKGKEIVFVLPEYVGSIAKLSRDDLEKVTGGIYRHIEENVMKILEYVT